MISAAAWFLYCTLVAGLLGLAALTAEESARSAGRPSRLLWFAAMLAAVTIPGVAYFGPDTWSPPLPAFSDGPVLPLAMITVVPASSDTLSVARLAVVAWLAMSGALVVYLIRSYVRLHGARRKWRRERLNGVDVWLTPNVGPAVFGVGEASILMPAWALELDERLRRLMLLHEEEHVRAGDPQLVLAALLVLIAMPWNVVLWWQLRRLRMAVEVDCDGRVLRREPDRRRYGTLLLEVGRRRGGSSLVVAFAEPRAFLERRIRNITARSTRNIGRAVSLGVISATFFAAAFCARDPVALAAVPVDAVTSDAGDEAPAVSDGPGYTRFTVEPELANGAEVAARLNESYPPLLRDAGIGGTAVLWFYIDEWGRVVRSLVHRSSGHAALDAAALRVAETMRFSPALNRDAAVAVWVQVPLTFAAPAPTAAAGELPAATADRPGAPPAEASASPLGGESRGAVLATAAPASAEPAQIRMPTASAARTIAHRLFEVSAPVTTTRPRASGGSGATTEQPPPLASLAAGPRYTPYTRKPALLNPSDVASALRRDYPPQLRDSGVGGTALVWLLISEAGAVERRQIHRTSGHDALDEAALSVADRMRFAPAENEGATVPVWVQIPITFASR